MYNSHNRKLKPAIAYLGKTIKFYQLKNEMLAPLVFVISLALSFLSIIYSFRISEPDLLKFDTKNITEIINVIKYLSKINIINAITFVFVNIFLCPYLISYINELRGIDFSFKDSMNVLKRALPIIILSVIMQITVFLGVIAFVIPGLVVYILLLFSNCFMLDKKMGVIESIKASINITNGNKIKIFYILVFYNLLALLVPTLVNYNGGPLVNTFISAFMTTIFNIMFQRLIAQMYIDLVYPKVEPQ